MRNSRFPRHATEHIFRTRLNAVILQLVVQLTWHNITTGIHTDLRTSELDRNCTTSLGKDSARTGHVPRKGWSFIVCLSKKHRMRVLHHREEL